MGHDPHSINYNYSPRVTKVNISKYSPRRTQGGYLSIFTEPVVNNCFSIIFRAE